MKIAYFGLLVFFCTQQEPSSAAIVRRAPAFAKPVFSNSYLPAAMQVIFHAVGQLKSLESEESAVQNSTTPSTTTANNDIAATSPHAPGQHQPIIQNPASSSTMNPEAMSDNGVPEVPTSSPLPVIASSEVSTTTSASTLPSAETSSASSPSIIDVDANRASGTIDKSAINAGSVKLRDIEEATNPIETETPEGNYATPEINHEIQESTQEVQESVHEVAETNHEVAENSTDRTTSSSHDINKSDTESSTVLSMEHDDSEENSSEESDEEKNSSEESDEEKNSSEETEEGRNGSGSSEESKQEERDSSEEEDDEIRFTLIGEKVSQVPRPSLSNYLRKTVKSPLRSTTQELAALYDALSKDARKQGLAKYSGFSDEVLKTLESSAEGGVGSQMRILLEKTQQRKELTRDDAKSKLSSTLRNLNDPSSLLNRDLRPLIPLRYVP